MVPGAETQTHEIVCTVQELFTNVSNCTAAPGQWCLQPWPPLAEMLTTNQIWLGRSLQYHPISHVAVSRPVDAGQPTLLVKACIEAHMLQNPDAVGGLKRGVHLHTIQCVCDDTTPRTEARKGRGGVRSGGAAVILSGC